MRTDGRGAAKGPPRRIPFPDLLFLPQKTSWIPDVKGATPARGSIRCPASSAQGPLTNHEGGPCAGRTPDREGSLSFGEETGPTWSCLGLRGLPSRAWCVVTNEEGEEEKETTSATRRPQSWAGGRSVGRAAGDLGGSLGRRGAAGQPDRALLRQTGEGTPPPSTAAGGSATREWTCWLPQPSPQMQKRDNLMIPNSCKMTCQQVAGTIPFDFGRGCHPLEVTALLASG